MDKKAKLFTKRIAERFSNDAKNKTLNTKTLLYKSIKNVSKESLKRKLQDKFDLYLKYLNKCVRKKQAKSQVGESNDVKLIQTWDECLQLSQLTKEENRQICVRLVLKELEHTDKKILQLVDQFEEVCGTAKDDPVPSWMGTCKHLLMSTTHPEIITKLMLYYLLKIIPVSENCLQSGRDTKTIADALKEFLVLSHLRFKKAESPEEERPPRRGDILASLLSIFIDLRVGDKSLNDKKVSREITSLTSYLLCNDWLLKMDVLIQVTSPANSPSLLLFAGSCLEQIPDNFADCASYLKFMMCLAKFKDHIEEIILQCMKIRAPLGFIDWLTERSPETMAEIPDDVRFKGRQITHFLLNNLSEDLQSQLLDVLTDKEAAAYVSAVNSPAVENTEVMHEMDQRPEELFVMDKQGENQKKKSRRKSQGAKEKKSIETEEPEGLDEDKEAVQEDVEVVDLSNMLDAIHASRQSSDVMGVEYVSNSSQDSPRTQTSLSKFKTPAGKVKRKDKNRTPDDTIVLDTETSSEAEDNRSLLIPDILSHLRHEMEDNEIWSPVNGRRKIEVDITIGEGGGKVEEIVIDSDSTPSVTSPKKKKKSRRSSQESLILLDGPISPRKRQLDPVMETMQEGASPVKKNGSGDYGDNTGMDIVVSLQRSPKKDVKTDFTEIKLSKSRRRSTSSMSESELSAGKSVSTSSPAKFIVKSTPRKTRNSVSEAEQRIDKGSGVTSEQTVKTTANLPEVRETQDKSPSKSPKKSSPRKSFSQTQEESETTNNDLSRKDRLSVTEMGSIAKAARESVNTESDTSESGKRRKRRSSKLDINLYDLSISTPKKGKKASGIESTPGRKSRSSASETDEGGPKGRRRRNSQTESASPSKLVKSGQGQSSSRDNSTPVQGRKKEVTSSGEDSVFLSPNKKISMSSPSKTSVQDSDIHQTPTKRTRRNSSAEEPDTVNLSRSTPRKSLKSTPGRGALKTPVSKASLKTPLGKSVARKTPRKSEAMGTPDGLEVQKTLQHNATLTAPSNDLKDSPTGKPTAKTSRIQTPHKTAAEESLSNKTLLKTPLSKSLLKTPKSKAALKTPKGKTPKSKATVSSKHQSDIQTPNSSDAKKTPRKGESERSPCKDTEKSPSNDTDASLLKDSNNLSPNKVKSFSPNKASENNSPSKETMSVDPKNTPGMMTPRRSTRAMDSPMVTRSGKKLSTPSKHLQTPARGVSIPDSIQEEGVPNRTTPRRQLVKSTPKRTPRKRDI